MYDPTQRSTEGAERYLLFPVANHSKSVAWIRVQSHQSNRTSQGLLCFVTDSSIETSVEQIVRHNRTSGSERGGERERQINVYLADYGANLPSGESYGLALGLADKLARYAPRPDSELPRAVATGVLGVGGKVGRVESFGEKLGAIERSLQENAGLLCAGDLLLYPKDQPLSSAEGSRIKELEKKYGLRPLAVDHIDELEWYWLHGEDSPRPKAEKRRQSGLWIAAGLLAVGIVGGLLLPLLPSPPLQRSAPEENPLPLPDCRTPLLNSQNLSACGVAVHWQALPQGGAAQPLVDGMTLAPGDRVAVQLNLPPHLQRHSRLLLVSRYDNGGMGIGDLMRLEQCNASGCAPLTLNTESGDETLYFIALEQPHHELERHFANQDPVAVIHLLEQQLHGLGYRVQFRKEG